MKRIPLPNETEDGWSYDPSSIEHVIEARLRRQEHSKRRRRETVQVEPSRSKKAALGLNEAEIAEIKWEAVRRFFDAAKLSDELRDRRAQFRQTFLERTKRFEKNGDAEIAEEARLQAVLFARVCERAIADATGYFADMLTQAVVAARGRKDFSLSFWAEMWAECLRFAMSLAEFGTASEWCGKAWGDASKEAPLPHIYRLDSMPKQRAESLKFTEAFKRDFQERLRHGSDMWLSEAERRITLRCLLSYAPGRGDTPKDKSKRVVMLLLIASPDLSARQVCAKLDQRNEQSPGSAPIPEPWGKKGARSWIEAYDKFQNAVEVFISKIKNRAGIGSGSRP